MLDELEDYELTDAQKHEQVQLDLDIKWLMKTKQGRRLAWVLLEQAGIFRPVFNQDVALMSFNEGQRNSGLKLLSLITHACNDLLIVMLKENSEKED